MFCSQVIMIVLCIVSSAVCSCVLVAPSKIWHLYTLGVLPQMFSTWLCRLCLLAARQEMIPKMIEAPNLLQQIYYNILQYTIVY